MITVGCSEGSEREAPGPVGELTTGRDLEPDSVNPEAAAGHSLDSEFACNFNSIVRSACIPGIKHNLT